MLMSVLCMVSDVDEEIDQAGVGVAPDDADVPATILNGNAATPGVVAFVFALAGPMMITTVATLNLAKHGCSEQHKHATY